MLTYAHMYMDHASRFYQIISTTARASDVRLKVGCPNWRPTPAPVRGMRNCWLQHRCVRPHTDGCGWATLRASGWMLWGVQFVYPHFVTMSKEQEDVVFLKIFGDHSTETRVRARHSERI
eukprot:111892-Prorocentrum_minimum.AAC.4